MNQALRQATINSLERKPEQKRAALSGSFLGNESAVVLRRELVNRLDERAGVSRIDFGGNAVTQVEYMPVAMTETEAA